jgi:hypothetical protein
LRILGFVSEPGDAASGPNAAAEALGIALSSTMISTPSKPKLAQQMSALGQ